MVKHSRRYDVGHKQTIEAFFAEHQKRVSERMNEQPYQVEIRHGCGVKVIALEREPDELLMKRGEIGKRMANGIQVEQV